MTKIASLYHCFCLKFNIAAVKCVADLCSLSDPTNSADKRVFGEHCIKLLLPPLLSAFIATSDDTLSIEIAKLLAKIQSYAPSDEKKG